MVEGACLGEWYFAQNTPECQEPVRNIPHFGQAKMTDFMEDLKLPKGFYCPAEAAVLTPFSNYGVINAC
jgi:hypothetical protein